MEKQEVYIELEVWKDTGQGEGKGNEIEYVLDVM